MIYNKRAELVESPPTKLQFKDFYRQFRAREKETPVSAKNFAEQCLQWMPTKVHWRIYLEMADLAKRENKLYEARSLYIKVNQLQPFASQGWLEHSKMEEECGELSRCQLILRQGLEFCSTNEGLLTKAIKHEERMDNIDAARHLLGRLKTVGIDKAWRTMLEGALLEARAGKVTTARRIFRYLMLHVPWYGPIYLEAFRFEERCEEREKALKIINGGLREIPRYGPLWFGAFRLCEVGDTQRLESKWAAQSDRWCKGGHKAAQTAQKGGKTEEKGGTVRSAGTSSTPEEEVDKLEVLKATRDVLNRAIHHISKELVWKVYLESAQIEERIASSAYLVARAAAGISKSGAGGAKKESKDNMGVRWQKAIERSAANCLRNCRSAYVQAIFNCPLNLRWKVWMAGARTEMSTGNNVKAARQLLRRALAEVPDKSRAQVLLECSRLEEYAGNVNSASRILARAQKETRHEWKVRSVLLFWVYCV
jgi:la-related protein 1